MAYQEEEDDNDKASIDKVKCWREEEIDDDDVSSVNLVDHMIIM